MTNLFYGSSLFQARKTDHVHRHSHLHSRQSHSDAHAHSHEEFHKRRADTAVLDSRDTTITEVVQTVDVVQVIDGSGATLSTQTVTGSSRTQLVDADTGATITTVDVANKAAATTSSDADAGSAVASVTAASSAAGESSGTVTSVPAALSLTHISASSFSTLSPTSNSTTSSLTSFASSSSISSSLSIPPSSLNTSSSSTFLNSVSSSPYSSNFVSSTTFASSTISSTISATSVPFSSYSSAGGSLSDSSSTGWLSASESPSATYSQGGADGSGASTASAGISSSSSTSASSGSSSGGVPTQTSEVVGGIFGGIAGVALLVGLAFMILRMRKSGWCQLKVPGGEDDGPAAASRAIGPAPTPAADGGSGAYGTMQPAGPQSVGASLAALAGKRASRERAGSGSEMAERGFVRVSGRKLPPVLQFGGDGYTDPRNDRNSQGSDISASVYRDSMAVFDQPNHTPLTLGSPMRPVSGIMTMHPGPRRTPVTSQTPSSIDSPTLPRSSTFPSTEPLGRTLDAEGFSRDAIGRTLAPQDYSRDGAASRDSRGSGRFTEHVS